MDELKLKTGFMRGIISRLVTKYLSEKIGLNLDVLVTDLEARTDDKQAVVRISGDLRMPTADLNKLVTSLGL